MQNLILVDFSYLLSLSHRKSLIPFVEKAASKVNSELILSKELNSTLDLLMAEALAHSRHLMEQCNIKVNLERERSKERSKRHTTVVSRHYSVLENKADISEDEEEKTLQVNTGNFTLRK